MKCERYGGAPPLVDGGVCQLANFSTFRLFDLLGSRKVGDLETWRGGAEGARRGGRSGRGFLVYRRGKTASAAVNVGWGVSRVSWSPRRGKARKGRRARRQEGK